MLLLMVCRISADMCETQDLSLSLRITCLVASLSQALLSVHNVHPALPAGPGEVPGQGLASPKDADEAL